MVNSKVSYIATKLKDKKITVENKAGITEGTLNKNIAIFEPQIETSKFKMSKPPRDTIT